MKKTANISLTQTHCTSAADDMSLDLGLTAGAVTHRIDEYTFIQERVKFFVYGSLVGLLLLGVDSVGVGEGELGEGLFPVGGDLAFDEAAVGFACGAVFSFFGAFAGAFVFDVADC